MSKEEISQQIEAAKKLVESMPPWKRNILVHSAQPSVSTPRQPVNNQSTSGVEARDAAK